MPAIDVVDVTKKYGDLAAVDRVSLEVAEGEFFGILGPNGAGKTTLLEIVEGLRRPDTGTASVLGLSAWPLSGSSVSGWSTRRTPGSRTCPGDRRSGSRSPAR
ncbi:hypothetical protein NSZ01_25860 [Nocardioides szechwanensis]|uniref:ABC transporter n=1 Tax=Nocardioides szechwanensis TaxID=1005944 RepID=A0A1H0ALV0_9ACTN|nr:hypothetical protein NSZ01_25860 [Nocardioides szechwanensis]SDN34341.1 ABC transporter [Nocardioides szechwanensis]